MFENLQRILHSKRISLKDFALLLGVSPKTAFDKIQGETEFTLSEVLHISKSLCPEYTIDYLFTISEEKVKVNNGYADGGKFHRPILCKSCSFFRSKLHKS